MLEEQDIISLIDKQRKCWPAYDERLRQLDEVKTKTFHIGGYSVIAQYNPAREVSSGAKVDKKSIEKRPCFLCSCNRPKEQIGLSILENYTVLVNPFPILKGHYTIVNNKHEDQRILDKICDLVSLCEIMPNHLVFYNGPRCGASAPDHLHFQAIKKGQLPLEEESKLLNKNILKNTQNGVISSLLKFGRKCIVIESEDKDYTVSLFQELYEQLSSTKEEPMMNIIGSYEKGKIILYILCRKKHRPSQYSDPDDPWMISPGAIDMGGVLVLPKANDFDRINEDVIKDIYSQVSL